MYVDQSIGERSIQSGQDAEASSGREPGDTAAGWPHLRYNLHLPDDDGVVLGRVGVSDSRDLHAQRTGVSIGHQRGARDVHDDTSGECRQLRLGQLRRVVPVQNLRTLRADPRESTQKRIYYPVSELYEHDEQDVLRYRSGERKEVKVYRGRVSQSDRHVQLLRRHLHQHYRRLRVHVPRYRPAPQVFRSSRQDHLYRHRRPI